MRLVINLVLVLITAGLTWLLVSSISEPIEFKREYDKREDAVIAKLTDIRTAQEHYRGITGKFAPSFDTLKQVLTEGRFAVIKAYGDRDAIGAEAQEIKFDTTWVPARDSIKVLGLELNNIEEVPFSEGALFKMQADTTTYQSTLVQVCEVSTPRKTYMGEFADPKFQMYDKNYDPFSTIKIGDMYKPSLAGNW